MYNRICMHYICTNTKAILEILDAIYTTNFDNFPHKHYKYIRSLQNVKLLKTFSQKIPELKELTVLHWLSVAEPGIVCT